MIIDPWGTVLDEIEQGEGIAIAEIDLEFVDSVRKRMPISQQRKL
jgi:predicted amidohydrolase